MTKYKYQVYFTCCLLLKEKLVKENELIKNELALKEREIKFQVR